MIAANKKIHWVPGHIKEGRFGKWLENARDWAISRNRYWGTPIPIWENEDGGKIVISSIEELEKRTGQKVDDLHRHHIDQLTFVDGGKTYKRVKEVFDCWFESGSMPYAQNHFPFDNKEETLNAFPADFIAEGLDQTRGWFYTLNVLSTALFDKPAFKNVIVNGIILAKDGNKMSKRLKNYPDPMDVINTYGADSVRLYLLHSPVVEGDDLRFTEDGLQLVLRQFLIPFWNSYVFFATYAKIYNWTPPKKIEKPDALIDRWILSRLQKLIRDVEEGMDKYTLSKAIDPFVKFIDELTNWYIRRCRTRFWTDVASKDRDQAFETLYTVLKCFVKVAAPFVPYISEDIYLQLKLDADPMSVHLCDFPSYNKTQRDTLLENEMSLAQSVVTLGHSLRKEHSMKVRQPLAKVSIICSKPHTLALLKHQKTLICEELNVKDILFEKQEDDFVDLVVKPNFPVLGKKVGPLMRQVKDAISKLDFEQKSKLLNKEDLDLIIDDKTISLTQEDISIERVIKKGVAAAVSGDIIVVLDTNLTEELQMEGLARELVNKINTMRKDQNFDVTDRINITLQTTKRLKICYEQFKDYINNEVLAESVSFADTDGKGWDLNGEQTIIFLEKISVTL